MKNIKKIIKWLVCTQVILITHVNLYSQTSKQLNEQVIWDASPKNKIEDTPDMGWGLISALMKGQNFYKYPAKESEIDPQLITACRKDAAKFMDEIIQKDVTIGPYLRKNYYPDYDKHIAIYKLPEDGIFFFICGFKPKYEGAPDMIIIYGYYFVTQKWFLRSFTLQM